MFLANGDRQVAIELLPDLEKNYRAWELKHQDPNGLFWQIDDRDGMEFTISGNGYRPTINSFMFGDAEAIAHIAEIAGQTEAAEQYRAKASRLRDVIDDRLWNRKDEFFETVPRHAAVGYSDVRELAGYIPWHFDILPQKYDVAWKYLFDRKGFAGRFGPTTAERRSLRFEYVANHECLWNGPSWPCYHADAGCPCQSSERT